MSEVRPLAREIIEQVFALLGDETVPMQPFSVQYQGFSVTADQLGTLPRTNAATYQLRRGSAEAGQWAEQSSIRVLLRRKGSKLEQVFQYPHGWRDVLYDLGSAWQTDTEAFIGFRMMNGSAGRNRWFGRRDEKIENRSLGQMEELTTQVRRELQQAFAAKNPDTDANLPAHWLTVARLPLTTPTTLQATTNTKTLLLRQLSQALVIGEVLRHESFPADAAPAYYLLGAKHDGQDQVSRFVAAGIWENGDPSRYGELLAQVRPGDRVALKSTFATGPVSYLRVKARGTVRAAEGDGHTLHINWDAPFPFFDLPGLGNYQRTVHLLTKPADIANIFQLAAPMLPTAMQQPLNQILYGPPGTGKTYSTTAWALALLHQVSVAEILRRSNEAERQQEFARFRAQGQIGFVSFHQSFGYEDFVEGIKPGLGEDDNESLSYRIEDGIFKAMVARAVYGLEQQRLARERRTGAAVPVSLNFDTVFDLFSSHLQERLATEEAGAVRFATKSNTQVVLKEVSSKGNLIFYHANGSPDSTFPVTKNRFAKLYQAFTTVADIANIDQDITRAIGGSNTSVFWAFFRAFKEFEQEQNHRFALDEPLGPADAPTDNTPPFYTLERPETVANLARKYDFAHLTPADYAAAPRFVLIIDEINRGNVASIFGELISLLEDDKRGGQPHELRVTLPYSKESFTVPPNLFVLGTMNTADRSVEALDTALRRRFSFHELAPQPQLLAANIEGVNLQKLLTALNDRLETLLDRDHRLGHAWLLKIKTLEDLRTVFDQKIIPQLQEFFYGHWGRIGQVLGAAFVRRKAAGTALMPGFEDDDIGELPDRYEITPAAWSAADFQGLYPA